jgi:colanic acid/amylovoran biosynthesis glycosyltransferase
MQTRSGTAGGGGTRPAVSVIMPFRGDAEAAHAALHALSSLRTRPGDELIIVDNGSDGGLDEARAQRADERIAVAQAYEVVSSYYARNVGAQRAASPWLLFLDSDCQPPSALLDEYFQEAVADDWGGIAGEVLPMDDDSSLAGWAASRGVLSQSASLERPPRPAAVTANLMVRRDAWRSVGGFLEGVRSGGDIDFCWRIQDAGWSLGYRPTASVRHPHRGTLRQLARQMARYGAGNAWLRRRYGEAPLRPAAVRGVIRGLAGTLIWLLALQPRRAAYKAIDAVAIAATQVGYLKSNVGRAERPRSGRIVVMTDCYATSTETFVTNEVRQLLTAGQAVRVESIIRPRRQLLGAARFAPVAYVEDAGVLARLRSLTWLLARHPLRAFSDVAERRAWDPEDRISMSALALTARRLAQGGEHHIHAHFATASAVTARRLERILGVPYSVTAHGFDIWVHPRKLPEKLTPAAFVTSGCAYNVRHLRELLGPVGAKRVQEIVMGVDPEEFRRSSPYPGGGTVAAVGRLVEKKGFGFLVAAAAEADHQLLERVLIVGDGPLRSSLLRMAEELGVADRLELLGSLGPSGVRSVLEAADLLAMPCVVGPDGDRDSMPVVVKEAMAMEIPVVATTEVGLPEAVAADRGRLVPPADPVSLARAIDELLRLSAEERAAMGRVGREWVLRHATLELQAAKLLELIDSVQADNSYPRHAGAPTPELGPSGGSAWEA